MEKKQSSCLPWYWVWCHAPISLSKRISLSRHTCSSVWSLARDTPQSNSFFSFVLAQFYINLYDCLRRNDMEPQPYRRRDCVIVSHRSRWSYKLIRQFHLKLLMWKKSSVESESPLKSLAISEKKYKIAWPARQQKLGTPIISTWCLLLCEFPICIAISWGATVFIIVLTSTKPNTKRRPMWSYLTNRKKEDSFTKNLKRNEYILLLISRGSETWEILHDGLGDDAYD